MKYLLFLLSITFSLNSVVSYQLPEISINLFQSEKTYYVYAKSGLNLREKEDVNSLKLINIPYGSEVKMLRDSEPADMLIDQIEGGMARIRYGDYIGYAFDGYLGRFPAPQNNTSVEDYVYTVREKGHEVYYEKIHRDWGGYSQFEESLVLPGKHWEEAFLIAKQLFGIPEKLYFPLNTQARETIIENPEKTPNTWNDQMEIFRESTELTQTNYSIRREGGGKVVEIKQDEKGKNLMISRTSIAD